MGLDARRTPHWEPQGRGPRRGEHLASAGDPLVKVTEQLRAWFEAEPWSSSSRLLEKLQAAYSVEYPDILLRTLQRRVKGWRREKATAMVFGALPDSVTVGLRVS